MREYSDLYQENMQKAKEQLEQKEEEQKMVDVKKENIMDKLGPGMKETFALA